jgi:hypothetical protein
MFIRRLICLGIVVFLLFSFFYFFVFSNNHIFNNLPVDQTSYQFNFIQDYSSYEYKIIIISSTGELERINNVWIFLQTEEDKTISNSSSIIPAENNLMIRFEHIEKPDWSKPYKDQDFINISLSIIYYDNDKDNYMSSGDYFILSTKNIDKNVYYNLTHLEFSLKSIKENYSIGLIHIYKTKNQGDSELVTVEKDPSYALRL